MKFELQTASASWFVHRRSELPYLAQKKRHAGPTLGKCGFPGWNGLVGWLAGRVSAANTKNAYKYGGWEVYINVSKKNLWELLFMIQAGNLTVGPWQVTETWYALKGWNKVPTSTNMLGFWTISRIECCNCRKKTSRKLQKDTKSTLGLTTNYLLAHHVWKSVMFCLFAHHYAQPQYNSCIYSEHRKKTHPHDILFDSQRLSYQKLQSLGTKWSMSCKSFSST